MNHARFSHLLAATATALLLATPLAAGANEGGGQGDAPKGAKKPKVCRQHAGTASKGISEAQRQALRRACQELRLAIAQAREKRAEAVRGLRSELRAAKTRAKESCQAAHQSNEGKGFGERGEACRAARQEFKRTAKELRKRMKQAKRTFRTDMRRAMKEFRGAVAEIRGERDRA